METRFVYITTADSQEARRIGRMLVERRLAACVNILKEMASIYWWDGEVQEGREAVLIAKTRAALVPDLTRAVMEAHSYTCPCVVSLPIESGNPAFMKWIGDETRPGNTSQP